MSWLKFDHGKGDWWAVLLAFALLCGVATIVAVGKEDMAHAVLFAFVTGAFIPIAFMEKRRGNGDE